MQGELEKRINHVSLAKNWNSALTSGIDHLGVIGLPKSSGKDGHTQVYLEAISMYMPLAFSFFLRWKASFSGCILYDVFENH